MKTLDKKFTAWRARAGGARMLLVNLAGSRRWRSNVARDFLSVEFRVLDFCTSNSPRPHGPPKIHIIISNDHNRASFQLVFLYHSLVGCTKATRKYL